MDPIRLLGDAGRLTEFIKNDVESLKGEEDIDYPLLRYAMIRNFNINQCGFEPSLNPDRELGNYIWEEFDDVTYNPLKEETRLFFLHYPEAYAITGLSLTDIRELTIAEFEDVRDLMKKHYELKVKFPNAQESLLREFRELKILMAHQMGVDLNAGKPRESNDTGNQPTL